jgi:protein MpaA
MLAGVGRLWTLLALLPAGCVTATTTAPDLASGRAPPVPANSRPTAPATRRRTIVLGRSADGRPITVAVLGDPRAPRRLLVVGCIHGNEAAGIAVAHALARGRAPRGVALWILPDLNPDGVAAGTRQNAHGVDLNRNFPYAWHPLGSRGALDFSGRAALSEPESRIASRLILRVRPAITIWFHQHQAVTDASGGDVRVERRFAGLSGLPLVHLTRYPGSAAGWQNHRLPHTTAFVVELPPGPATGGALQRSVRAVQTLAAGAALR